MRSAAWLALLLVPSAASGESLRVLDTLVLDYRGDNGNQLESDDDYAVAFTKLYVDGQAGETAARAEVDGVYFLTQYPDVGAGSATNRTTQYRSEARLERLSLAHRVGDATITLGDFHKQLGRGIALSLRRVDELGVDKALRGGQLQWDGDTLSWNVFAGRTNISNLDGVSQKFVEDPDDTIAGGQATLHVGTTDVSAYALVLQPKLPTDPANGDDRTALGGTYVELPAAEWLTVYAEGVVSRYSIVATDYRGSAAYGTADVSLPFVNLLLEGIYLDKFQVAGSMDQVLFQRRTIYNQPPTLERIDQELGDYENVRGSRVQLSRSFLDGGLVLYVNGTFRRSGPPSGTLDAVHGYGGFEYAYGSSRSRWFGSAGYREETIHGRTVATVAHGETDWVQSLGGVWAVHTTVNHEVRSQEGRSDDYLRGTTLFAVEHGNTWSLTGELGYDTEKEEVRQLFVAGIATYRPADWVILRTVVGSERGGRKCIGGVCRDYPAFQGARLEASVQHDLL